MSWKREKLKKALLGELEAQVEAMLDNISDEQQMTLSEIEDLVLQTRQSIGQKLTQAVVEVESQPAEVDVQCGKCGKKMQSKGKRPKQVTTQSGEIEVERNYYYCPSCREGIFPPG